MKKPKSSTAYIAASKFVSELEASLKTKSSEALRTMQVENLDFFDTCKDRVKAKKSEVEDVHHTIGIFKERILEVVRDAENISQNAECIVEHIAYLRNLIGDYFTYIDGSFQPEQLPHLIFQAESAPRKEG